MENDISYYISPNGDDKNPATKEKPVKTLSKALELSRQKNEERTIIVREGFYENVSVLLDERDCGLTLKAEGKAVLCGGSRIFNWTPVETGSPKTNSSKDNLSYDGTYRAKLPCDFPDDLRMITINGQFRERARYPQTGYLKHKSVFNSIWLSTSAGGWDIKPTAQQLTTLDFDPADIKADFDWQNAELTIFHKWDETLTSLSAYDFSNNKFKLSLSMTHPPGAFESQYYIVWNTIEGMTKGKWRIDKKERYIYYKPLDGENIFDIEVIAPVHQNIIKIKDGISRFCIDGLEFTSTHTPMVACGFGSLHLPGAIDAEIKTSISDCLFKNLYFTNLSGWGIKLTADKEAKGRNVTIENCQVNDSGGGGIRINGINNCIIKGNNISNIGKIYFSAIAIYTDRADTCVIIENELLNLPYTGICAGWKCDNILIKRNKVKNAVYILNDGGGIYVTGNKDGLITSNIVSDIFQKQDNPDISQRNGIYLDEQISGYIVENNLVYECPSALLNHMSKGNIIRNNAYVSTNGSVMLSFIRCQEYIIEKNAVQAAEEVTFAHRQDAFAKFDANLLYSSLNRIESVYVNDDYKRSEPVKLNPIQAN